MQKIMQLFNSQIGKKYRIEVSILIACAILIWFAGPHIMLGGKAPLLKSSKRCWTILSLLLAWVCKVLLQDNKPVQSKPSTQSVSVLTKCASVLESRLNHAMTLLNTTTVKMHGQRMRLHHLPWYLLIGSAGSGKTSLLANSKIPFVLKQLHGDEKLVHLPSTEVCDWWVTCDQVIIDVPGSFTTFKGKQRSLSNKLWLSFLNSISKLRGAAGLDGVVFAISLTELMDRTHREGLIADIKDRMQELKGKFGSHLAFYFTITKCDLLPGFQDFFSDCGINELSQAWGITLPELKENESKVDAVVSRFDALIGRLNKQLLWRMHQERNAYVRTYIKDFPLQVERVKDALVDVLNSLAQTKYPFALQGIYLTSATQDAETPQHAPYQTVSADEFNPAMEIMRPPLMLKQAYFIKQFILQALTPAAPDASKHKIINWQEPFLGYALVFAMVMITAITQSSDLLHPIQFVAAERHHLALNKVQSEVSANANVVSISPPSDKALLSDANQHIAKEAAVSEPVVKNIAALAKKAGTA